MAEVNSSEEITKEVELGMKLEGIFSPIARRRRDFLNRTNPTGPFDKFPRFVHYTTAEAALSIIKSKRFWLRNSTCMSDFREVDHGHDILLAFVSDPAKNKEFKSALDACWPGAAEEAFTLFDQHWASIKFSTYIASFSEHGDDEDVHGRLSMWRAIRPANARVALVFRVPRFGIPNFRLHFNPVSYLTTSEGDRSMHEVVEQVRANCDFLKSLDRSIIVGSVFYMCLGAVTCMKHEGFKEEREWRAIYSTFDTSDDATVMERSIETVDGVPQIVCKVPLDKTVSPLLEPLDFARIFDRLIIGPSSYPWVMYEAFCNALADSGVQDSGKKVINSTIPIRSP